MLQRLSKSQLEILRSLDKEHISFDDIQDRSAFNFLCEQGCAFYVIETIDKRDVPAYAAITEHGKSYLATIDDEDKKYAQTRCLAVWALAISIISVLFTGLTYLSEYL